MANDINNHEFYITAELPYIHYLINYTKSRTNNTTMKYDFTITAWLNSSASYMLTGYALNCTLTVGGVSASVRIKSNSNDDWRGTTPRVRTVSITCTESAGNTAQTVRFRTVSDGNLTMKCGVIDNSDYTVTSSALSITKCTAPTAFTCAETLTSGATVSVSWSGASAGTNNSITGYEFQYSDGSAGGTWGSWVSAGTFASTSRSGTTTLSTPSAGIYRRFRIRTMGSAGTAYYSDWFISTNNVRRSINPSAPTKVTASPSPYSNPVITVAWSGASAGTSPIAGYEIQRASSTTSTGYGNYTTVASTTQSETSGSCSVNVSGLDGLYIQFRVRTKDTAGNYSGYTTSNSVKKVGIPSTPEIIAPSTEYASTFCKTPRLIFKIPAHTDGAKQKIIVKVGGKYSLSSDTSTKYFSVGGLFSGEKTIVFRSPPLDYGIYTVSVVVYDESGYSGTSSSRSFSIVKFTAPTLVPNVTIVAYWHLTNAQSYVNTLRLFYGLSDSVFDKITSGKTQIWDFPIHVTQIRNSFSELRTLINGYAGSSSVAIQAVNWINIGNFRPRADVVLQLYVLFKYFRYNQNTYGDLKGKKHSELSEFDYEELKWEEFFK